MQQYTLRDEIKAWLWVAVFVGVFGFMGYGVMSGTFLHWHCNWVGGEFYIEKTPSGVTISPGVCKYEVIYEKVED